MYRTSAIVRFSSTLILISAFMTMATRGVFAREIKFEVNIDRNRIAIGETAQLGLSFYGTQNMPAPDLGNVDGLEIRYVGPSTMMTVMNGQVSSSITHRYSVLPLKLGKFQLGPYKFNYKSDDYVSNMVFLEAVEERVRQSVQDERPVTEKMNLEDRIYLTLAVDKVSAYVNELVPVTVKLYVNNLNVSDIQLPSFAQEGFSKVDFKEPKQYRERVGDLVYDVLEFKTGMFGTRAGDYRLGPAKIKCNVMVRKRVPKGSGLRDDFFGDDHYRDSFFEDFFTRYEKYPLELKSPDAQLIVSPLPSDGVPPDFSGAVGDYQFIFTANPRKVKAGDPITLRMDINGSGNFNTVLAPKLEDAAGFRIYEPQVKTEEGRKSFIQVIMPETPGVTQTPKASFSYFEPASKQYRTITQGSVPIIVEKGKEEAAPQVVGPAPGKEPVEKEELSRDLVYIKDSPGAWSVAGSALYMSSYFRFIMGIPIFAVFVVFVIEARRQRIRRDTIYAGRIWSVKAMRKGLRELRKHVNDKDCGIFYETMFITLQKYLGYRIGVSPAGVTSDVVEDALRTKLIDNDIINKVKRLFELCDMARFAEMRQDGMRMQDDLKYFEEIVRYLERARL